MRQSTQERDRLFFEHTGLVWYVARRFFGKSIQGPGARRIGSREDVIQVGHLALLRAAQQWNKKRGTAFKTYAIAAIRNAFRRELATGSLIALAMQYESVYVDEFPDVVKVDRFTAEILSKLAMEDRNPFACEEVTLGMNLLPAKYSDYLRLYYFKEKTYKEIGQVYGITDSRAQQIVIEARRKLGERIRQLDGGLRRCC